MRKCLFGFIAGISYFKPGVLWTFPVAMKKELRYMFFVFLYSFLYISPEYIRFVQIFRVR